MYNLNSMSVHEKNSFNILDVQNKNRIDISTNLNKSLDLKTNIISGVAIVFCIFSTNAMQAVANRIDLNSSGVTIPCVIDNNNHNRTYTDVLNVSQISYNNSIIDLNNNSKDVNDVVIENKINNVEIQPIKKPLLLADNIEEYDYYVDVPKKNISVIECSYVVEKKNEFRLS